MGLTIPWKWEQHLKKLVMCDLNEVDLKLNYFDIYMRNNNVDDQKIGNLKNLEKMKTLEKSTF